MPATIRPPTGRLLLMCAFIITPAATARAQSFVNYESPHVHPLDLTPDSARLLAVNTADNRLEIFDLSSGIPVHAASVPVGLEPVSVRARTNTEAWVVNLLSDSISIVDLPTARTRQTLLTGDEPADVVFAGSPQRAFVTLSQLNQIRVFVPTNLAASPTILNIEGEDPRALAVDSTGSRVYAAIFESGNRTSIIARQQVSAPTGPYAGQNPPPNAGNNFNPPIDPTLPAPPPVAQIVRRLAPGLWLDDNGGDWSAFVTWDLHDHDIAIIDTATLAVTYATDLMTTIMGIAVSPSGAVTVVGTEALNEIRYEPNLRGTFLRVNMASFPAATPTARTITDLNPHLSYINGTESQSTRDQSIGDPRAILWHPSGTKAYVAGMGSNNVIVISPTGSRIAQIIVPEGPTGLALDPAANRLFVLSKFADAISVIDTTTDTLIDATPLFDPTPASIKIGRPLLYDTHATSGLGHAACASCHVDGRTDHLAWDLGDPSGDLKIFNATCRVPNTCEPWHPMKGPMVTQSLQGIVTNEPFHWRGDRENLAAFDVAFTGLQGDDAMPSSSDMQKFTDYVATIQYPPNPNRNIDNTLPAALATTTGNGNPNNGRNIYLNQPVLPGGLRCVSCHALPDGSDLTIDSPPVLIQQLKIAQLRNMHEKTGFNRASTNGNRGFGFNHDSDFDSLFALLSVGFQFPIGAPGQQQRRDVEAFMLCFSADSHAGIGQQITFDGTNNNDATLTARLTTFTNQANTGLVSLVAKGLVSGEARGYAYIGANNLQSDRAAQIVSATTLRQSAVAGNEITFTLVPNGSQTRIGIDRDSDGFFDRDELDACRDPANAANTPATPPSADIDRDGDEDESDLQALIAVLLGTPLHPSHTARCDLNCDAAADGRDAAFFIEGFLAD